MYKQPEMAGSYVGTSHAAKIMQLSVGTIQKLVKEGQLPAFLTTGGHRRIPYEAVLEYCRTNMIPAGVMRTNTERMADLINICILHDSKKITSNLESITKEGTFQVITDPMKLLKTEAQLTHIFMDARITWMNWMQMERSSNERIQYVVYNSNVLPHAARKHLEKVAALLDADISIEFLYGYRLGFQSNPLDQGPRSYRFTVRQ
jgi:excisionase family DNA binding protein